MCSSSRLETLEEDEHMSDVTATVDTYLAMWNETDAARRDTAG